jgi:hypothetical protein
MGHDGTQQRVDAHPGGDEDIGERFDVGRARGVVDVVAPELGGHETGRVPLLRTVDELVDGAGATPRARRKPEELLGSGVVIGTPETRRQHRIGAERHDDAESGPGPRHLGDVAFGEVAHTDGVEFHELASEVLLGATVDVGDVVEVAEHPAVGHDRRGQHGEVAEAVAVVGLDLAPQGPELAHLRRCRMRSGCARTVPASR